MQRLFAVIRYAKYVWFFVKLLFRWERSAAQLISKETSMSIVKETIEVIAFGMAFGGDIVASLKDDGKITFADLAKFGNLSSLAMPAITDIKLVPQELANIDEAGLTQIKDYILANAATIPGIEEKWLKVASGALKIGLGVLEIVEALKTPEVVPA